ncbi:hypothetical protein [Alkalihalobacterium bogoriense]|uniref:hypothetical protein n=1 Tax=Alkalihalobacterium bogoriense TaxID=246272 RepID=UPI00047C4529|nr:hypothetical protein [Alkalihalobacterium bogoriense]
MSIFETVSIFMISFIAILFAVFFIKWNKRTLQQLALLQNLLRTVENLTIETRQNSEKLNEEWRSYVFIQALTVREAVYKQTIALHPQLIEDAPVTHGLSTPELSKAFRPEEIQAIYEFWTIFNEYKSTYWLTNDNRIRTVFRGTIHDENSEIAHLAFASKKLVQQLDRQLKQIRATTFT